MKHILVKFDQADQIINFVRIINRYSYAAVWLMQSQWLVCYPWQSPRQWSSFFIQMNATRFWKKSLLMQHDLT